ncbi:MAG TPA: putative O-glycosylation ligase, exosortase A system-associated [Rhodopila sp.]|nr:putative O-glycosylation ligase, exosortase A system-associated [Rhodopila sp.]
MIRSLLLTFGYLSFFAAGFNAPFALTLGYVWVDGANPQALSYGSGLLPMLPISMIIGACAIGFYVLMDRRYPPPFNLGIGIIVLFAVWATIVTCFAEVPAQAWIKWNVAIKTLLFSAFLPFVIRSRIQIEAFLLIFVLSTAVFFMPVGAKTMISGGGYGRTLAVVSENTGLAEGATLATVSLLLLPVMAWLTSHSLLLAPRSPRKLGFAVLGLLAVAASIGTYERTALIGLGTVGTMMWLRSRRKLLSGFVMLLILAGIVATASSSWVERISTVKSYDQESSALGRILVWRWTMDYVAQHPLGGGFNVFYINHIIFPDGQEVFGKAFHSIYFEVLGELGIPGILMFGGLLLWTLFGLQRVAKQTRERPGLGWIRDLAYALQAALLTLMTCGMFIGIAFQPFIYYIVAVSISLMAYVQRTEQPSRTTDLPHRVPSAAHRLARPASSLAPVGSMTVSAGSRGAAYEWPIERP